MQQGRTHPMFIVAALLFSLLGAAAVTGMLPNAETIHAERQAQAR
jgi:hypothetical protein